MQNPNEDTEWNDILRSKGILPPKTKEKEITEDEVVNIVESTINEKINASGKKIENLSLDELDELEDDEDEIVLQQYRNRRIAEMKELAKKSKFGDVIEISGSDFVTEVNNAGPDIWVVLVLYKQGIPICNKINQYLSVMANKHPTVKFIKSISTTCIAGYPDFNLPTLFVYHNGSKEHMLTARDISWDKMDIFAFERLLHQAGAVPNPPSRESSPDRDKPVDVLFLQLQTQSK